MPPATETHPNYYPCLICYNNTEAETEDIQLRLENKNEDIISILHTFCSNFGIKLPLKSTNGAYVYFPPDHISKDDLETISYSPFCSTCKVIAKNLVNLHKQLEFIQNEIEQAKLNIRSSIRNSYIKYKKQDLHNLLRKKIRKLSNSEAKIVNKDGNMIADNDQQGSVQLIRDLIAGPFIRIKKCNELPIFSQFDISQFSSNKIEDEYEIRPEIEYEEEMQILHSVSKSKPKRKLKSKRLSRRYENIVKTKLINAVSNQVCTVNENNAKIEKAPSSAGTEVSAVSVVIDEKENSQLNLKSSTKTQNQDCEEVDALNSPYHDSEEQFDDLEDFDDKNFELSDQDQELSSSDSTTSRSSEQIQTIFVQVQRRSNKQKRLNSNFRVRSQTNKSLEKADNYRKTVKCDGEDRYVYDEQFEFTGNQVVGFQCSLCPEKKFPSKPKVKCHIRLAHVPKQKICPVCGKGFSMTKLLNQHIHLTHDPDRTVVCDICGKTLNRNTLTVHKKNVHFGERKYICEQCGKGFTSIQILRRHMTTHSSYQPFACSHCGQKFKKKGTRTRHLKQFHGYPKTISSSASSIPVPVPETRLLPLQISMPTSVVPEQDMLINVNSYHHKEKECESDDLDARVREMTTDQDMAMTMNTCQFDILPVPVEPSSSSAATEIENCQSHGQNQTAVDESDDDPSKLSLKCKYCGRQYNRQNNLTRHLLQIHHINVKGLSWKTKSRRQMYYQSQNIHRNPSITYDQDIIAPGSSDLPVPVLSMPLPLPIPVLPFPSLEVPNIPFSSMHTQIRSSDYDS